MLGSVKKPYNPVLNEFFRCMYYYPDGTTAYYVAEQVSHHPVGWRRRPCRSHTAHLCLLLCRPQDGRFGDWRAQAKGASSVAAACLTTQSKFLGNSAATIMEGEDRIRLLQRPEDGEYSITVSLNFWPQSSSNTPDAQHVRPWYPVRQDGSRAR